MQQFCCQRLRRYCWKGIFGLPPVCNCCMMSIRIERQERGLFMKQEERLAAVERLKALEERLAALRHAMGMLSFDAATVAPEDTAEGRGRTMGVLSGMEHELLADPANAALLDALEAAGGARVMLEQDFTTDSLLGLVSELLQHPEQLDEMSKKMLELGVPGATDRIAAEVLVLAGK